MAALRQNRFTDYAAMTVAILGVCIPTFVTAPLLVLVIASKLGWLPTAGWNDGALANLILPVIVLALPQIAIISRLTRAGMIEVLHSNYIRTARAKGLPECLIVRKHALRAALMPLVSYLGPACAGLITGSLVVEKIFNLPGLGKFFVDQRPAARLHGRDGHGDRLRRADPGAEPDRRPALRGARSPGAPRMSVLASERADSRTAPLCARSAAACGRTPAAACCATRPPSPA